MTKNNKQTIVIIESTDGCGKTTIKKALERASNWKYIVLDRFIGSDIVYDAIYNRKNRARMLLKLENNLTKIANVLLIYLDCNLNEQLRRLKIKKEDKIIIKNISIAKKLFEEYLDNTNLNYIIIDTSKNTINKCVEDIINFVENKVEI